MYDAHCHRLEPFDVTEPLEKNRREGGRGKGKRNKEFQSRTFKKPSV
jgi:hypothetical protein